MTMRMQVVSVGLAGLDYLAVVDHFPVPDEKMRTQGALQQQGGPAPVCIMHFSAYLLTPSCISAPRIVHGGGPKSCVHADVPTLSVELVRSLCFPVPAGGGNAANTCTALARLGVDVSLVTALGDDLVARAIVSQLEGEGVGVAHVHTTPNSSSPFSYIIVDTASSTRTCIHTPGPTYPPDRLPGLASGWLRQTALLHCDARNTAAAIAAARQANSAAVPVLLDAERDRPLMAELVPLCDYLVTNETFPCAWTGEGDLEAAMVLLLATTRATCIITTLGAAGSCAVCHRDSWRPHRLFGGLQANRKEATPNNDSNTLPRMARMAVVAGVAGRAAQLQPTNQIQNRTVAFDHPPPTTHETFTMGGNEYTRVHLPAYPLEQPVADSTGAGDAFVAGVVYGLTHALGIAETLQLGSYLAAQSCLQVGARCGLPRLAGVFNSPHGST